MDAQTDIKECYHIPSTTGYLRVPICHIGITNFFLHLVTYLDMGNFCDKSTETTLHEISGQVFLTFSDFSKPSQSVLLIYKFAWFAGFRKSEENFIKTSCKVVSVTKFAHIIWWHHDNGKQSASAREHWCDVSCDIPYFGSQSHTYMQNTTHG